MKSGGTNLDWDVQQGDMDNIVYCMSIFKGEKRFKCRCFYWGGHASNRQS